MLLRVNSPGGSATASDTIWREVVRLRAAGKPVVVSMSDVAASGGYFIADAGRRHRRAAGHDHRVDRRDHGQAGARRTRWNGSASPPIRWPWAARANMFAPTHPFTEDEWDRINVLARRDLPDFIGKVAAGRRMTRRAGARGGPGPGLDRRRRRGERAGRRARRDGRPRPRSPAAGPGCPPTRRCGSTPAHPARPAPAAGVERVAARRGGRAGPRLRPTGMRAGARPGGWRPGRACRRTDR